MASMFYSAVANGVFNMIGSQTSADVMDSRDSSYEPEKSEKMKPWKEQYHKGESDIIDDLSKAHDNLHAEHEQLKAIHARLEGAFKDIENRSNRDEANLSHAAQLLAERERALTHAEARNRDLSTLLKLRTFKSSAFHESFARAKQNANLTRAKERNKELEMLLERLSFELSNLEDLHITQSVDLSRAMEAVTESLQMLEDAEARSRRLASLLESGTSELIASQNLCTKRDADLAHALDDLAAKKRSLELAEARNKKLTALLKKNNDGPASSQTFAPAAKRVTDACVTTNARVQRRGGERW